MAHDQANQGAAMDGLTGAFLILAIVVYTVTGGADFGAGILELFASTETKDEEREVITRAMGPVWEANHVWLILAVVILFTAYPVLFAAISVTFHIPLTLMLIGIVFRGCAFSFRHYDAWKDRSEDFYSLLFTLGSLIAPFAQGLIIGSLVTGGLQAAPTSFYAGFIAPWLGLIPIMAGLLVCSLFAFLAAAYLVSETDLPYLQQVFEDRMVQAGFIATLLLVAILGYGTIQEFGSRFVYAAAVCAAALPLGMVLRKHLRHANPFVPRVLAGGVLSLIIFAWLILQVPILQRESFFVPVSRNTIWQLLLALIAGSCLILPALGFLFKTFKGAERNRPDEMDPPGPRPEGTFP